MFKCGLLMDFEVDYIGTRVVEPLSSSFDRGQNWHLALVVCAIVIRDI
jgi:hypothetical protein